MVTQRGLNLQNLVIFNIYAQIVSSRHFILCKVASKTQNFILADILVLVSEFLVVVILSEWWLFYQSGGQGRPLPTAVGTSLSDRPLGLDIPYGGKLWRGETLANLANDHKFAKFFPTKFYASNRS